MNEVELLFSEVLGCDRASLYLGRKKLLDENTLMFVASVLKRRIKGEPIQYILGKTEFMGFEFKVNPNVLIPRPETEILVETTLRYADNKKRINILDLGTGSGCIAISLRKNLESEVEASDISLKALEVAKENAGLNNVKINFIQSDLFASLGHKEYDMVVTNPPYVASGQISKLQPELRFEPEIALSAGADGLDFYRGLALGAASHLKKGGLLFMEIGFGQKPDIEKIFSDSGKFEIIEAVKDYNGIDRVIVAKKIMDNRIRIREKKWIN